MEGREKKCWAVFIAHSNQEAVATLLTTLLTQGGCPQEKKCVWIFWKHKANSLQEQERGKGEKHDVTALVRWRGVSRDAIMLLPTQQPLRVRAHFRHGDSNSYSKRLECGRCYFNILNIRLWLEDSITGKWILLHWLTNSLVFHFIWFRKGSNHIHKSYTQHDTLLGGARVRKNCSK